VFERKILRKIFGPNKEANGKWRIKTNKELDELIKHRNVNHSQEDQLEGPSLDGTMMSGMI